MDDLLDANADDSLFGHSVDCPCGQVSLPLEVGLYGRDLRIGVFAKDRIVVDAEDADFLRDANADFMADINNLICPVIAGGQDAAGLRQGFQPGDERGAVFGFVRIVRDVKHAANEPRLLQCVPERSAAFQAPVVVRAIARIPVALEDTL